MKPGPLIYAALCAAAITFLVIANMRGYIPFVSDTASASRDASGARHFHK